MALRELKLTDLQIRSCSLWVAPDGTKYLPVPHTIPFYHSAPAQAFPETGVELGTPAKYEFVCKVVSACLNTVRVPSIPNPTVQIQWPDGRYLSNPGVDVFSFVATGANGRLVKPHKRMPAASKIRMNIDNTAAGAIAYQIVMFFEGCLLVPLAELGVSNGRG